METSAFVKNACSFLLANLFKNNILISAYWKDTASS